MSQQQVSNLGLQNILPMRKKPTLKVVNKTYRSRKGTCLGGAHTLTTIEDINKLKNFFLNYDNGTARNNMGYRNYALVVFALNTLKRGGDILRTTIEDIFNSDMTFKKEFYIKEEKTNKTARVYINKAMQEAIALYISNDELRNSIQIEMHQPLFMSRQKDKQGNYKSIALRTYNDWLTKAKKELGWENKRISSHSCRKSASRIIYEQSKDDPNKARMNLAWLQEQLNHSSQSTTLRYLGISNDESDSIHDSIQF